MVSFSFFSHWNNNILRQTLTSYKIKIPLQTRYLPEVSRYWLKWSTKKQSIILVQGNFLKVFVFLFRLLISKRN